MILALISIAIYGGGLLLILGAVAIYLNKLF